MKESELPLTPEKPAFIEGYGPDIWMRLEMLSENGAQITNIHAGKHCSPAWWRIDIVWPERKP